MNPLSLLMADFVFLSETARDGRIYNIYAFMLAFLYKNQFSKSCFEYNSKGVKLLNSVICFFLKVLYRQMGRTSEKIC